MSRLISFVTAAALVAGCTPEFAFTGEGGGGGGDGLPQVQVSPALPAPGNLVTFDSSPLGDGLRSWDFGGGISATGMVVTHTWTEAGSYEVRLLLDDGISGPVEHTVQVTVASPGEEPEIRQPALSRARR